MPTISRWLGALETSGQIALVPPYFQSAGKHLVKSPKISGAVVDADGGAMEQVEVHAELPPGFQPGPSTTDEEGRFRLEQIPAGDWQVVAEEAIARPPRGSTW